MEQNLPGWQVQGNHISIPGCIVTTAGLGASMCAMPHPHSKPLSHMPTTQCSNHKASPLIQYLCWLCLAGVMCCCHQSTGAVLCMIDLPPGSHKQHLAGCGVHARLANHTTCWILHAGVGKVSAAACVARPASLPTRSTPERAHLLSATCMTCALATSSEAPTQGCVCCSQS